MITSHMKLLYFKLHFQPQSERFKKEDIHELCRLFGLLHFHTPTCVIRSSTYVEDIDQKEVELCVKCKSAIELLTRNIKTINFH